jgi:hypothetical protein
MHVHSVENGEGNIKSCVEDPVTPLSNSQLIVVCTSQTAENRLVFTKRCSPLPALTTITELHGVKQTRLRPEIYLGLSSVVAASK